MLRLRRGAPAISKYRMPSARERLPQPSAMLAEIDSAERGNCADMTFFSRGSSQPRRAAKHHHRVPWPRPHEKFAEIVHGRRCSGTRCEHHRLPATRIIPLNFERSRRPPVWSTEPLSERARIGPSTLYFVYRVLRPGVWVSSRCCCNHRQLPPGPGDHPTTQHHGPLVEHQRLPGCDCGGTVG